MKKKDIILIAAALLLALALYGVSQLSFGSEASYVVVTVRGEEVLRRPLAMDGTYEIAQEDGGRNVVVVERGAVYVSEANCRDGLCIRQGRMRNGAKTIVCLPHEMVVTIQGDAIDQSGDDLDVIVQ